MDSHWTWFAVDVTRSGTSPTREMTPTEVRTIQRELKPYRWTEIGVREWEGTFGGLRKDRECTQAHMQSIHEKQGDCSLQVLLDRGCVERGAITIDGHDVRVTKLSEMRPEPKHRAENFAEGEVVVMQEKGSTLGQWWLIARVPSDNPLARALRPDNGRWSTDAAVVFSSPRALFDVGKAIGNADFPVKFTGSGGVKHDFLVYTTAYEQMLNSLTTIPESLFEVTNDDVCVMKNLQTEQGVLRCSFFFDNQGNFSGADVNGGEKFFALVVTKGWWYEILAETLFWALCAGVDWYNNVLFVSQTYRSTYLSLSFLVGMVAFLVLEGYYSWLLALSDMDYDVHEKDMALGNVGCLGWLYPFQVMLYYLRVPISVRDMTIWTCPRGGALGRVVVKAKGARIHILTWPTKFHYHCDCGRGKHKMFPMLLVKTIMLLMIQLLVFWVLQTPCHFVSLFLPKLILLLMMMRSFTISQKEREELRAWLLREWEKQRPDDRKMPQDKPRHRVLDALHGVYLKHFGDAVDGRLWDYNLWHHNVLLPYHKGAPMVPLYAFCAAVVITIASIIVATIADWL